MFWIKKYLFVEMHENAYFKYKIKHKVHTYNKKLYEDLTTLRDILKDDIESYRTIFIDGLSRFISKEEIKVKHEKLIVTIIDQIDQIIKDKNFDIICEKFDPLCINPLCIYCNNSLYNIHLECNHTKKICLEPKCWSNTGISRNTMCCNCFLIKDQENTIKYQKEIILKQEKQIKQLKRQRTVLNESKQIHKKQKKRKNKE
jgi:hypothetical protein